MSEINIAKQVSDKAEQDVVESVMKGILPKMAPMMKQAAKDFSEFLEGKEDGEEKTIVIKKFKNKPPAVIVFGNSRKFHIQCDGEKNMNIFKAEKSEDPEKNAVLFMFTAEEFVELLLSGKMKK